MNRAALAWALAATFPALAQSSASFRLDEHAVNAGGNPSQGVVASSAQFRITLDAVGEAASRRGLSSASYRADGGFVAAYPPPGEVGGLRFDDDKATLAWTPEPSVGDYALYRDDLQMLSTGQDGMCRQTAIPTASAVEPEPPTPGFGLFYLVTARNRLREEGTKGYRSGGVERSNAAPCP